MTRSEERQRLYCFSTLSSSGIEILLLDSGRAKKGLSLVVSGRKQREWIVAAVRKGGGGGDLGDAIYGTRRGRG